MKTQVLEAKWVGPRIDEKCDWCGQLAVAAYKLAYRDSFISRLFGKLHQDFVIREPRCRDHIYRQEVLDDLD